MRNQKERSFCVKKNKKAKPRVTLAPQQKRRVVARLGGWTASKWHGWVEVTLDDACEAEFTVVGGVICTVVVSDDTDNHTTGCLATCDVGGSSGSCGCLMLWKHDLMVGL